MIEFRKIERKDLSQVFPLLQQLTEIDYSSRDIDECWDAFKNNTSSNAIVGIYDNEIVAYGAVVIESKIRGESAGHIEDIVVDNKVRGKNIGVKLIKELVKIAKEKKCYRVTLFCDEPLVNFYKKNNFKTNGVAMKVFTK
jgi:ribosomal protein S18 acetylase RimI-like enzyme